MAIQFRNANDFAYPLQQKSLHSVTPKGQRTTHTGVSSRVWWTQQFVRRSNQNHTGIALQSAIHISITFVPTLLDQKITFLMGRIWLAWHGFLFLFPPTNKMMAWLSTASLTITVTAHTHRLNLSCQQNTADKTTEAIDSSSAHSPVLFYLV